MSGHWIDLFLDAIAAERGAAENTLAAYRRDLDDFASWLETQDLGLDAAVRADIEHYLSDLETRGFQETTRARRLSAIRQFYRDMPSGCVGDHIIPLRGENVSGLHVEGNLQYLTPKENAAKRNHFACGCAACTQTPPPTAPS